MFIVVHLRFRKKPDGLSRKATLAKYSPYTIDFHCSFVVARYVILASCQSYHHQLPAHDNLEKRGYCSLSYEIVGWLGQYHNEFGNWFTLVQQVSVSSIAKCKTCDSST